ncbi:MAG: hypothetical protein K1X71_16770 [Pirellulales bacterium]|nr:hypothetical protein [Pirellulales bacterium]
MSRMLHALAVAALLFNNSARLSAEPASIARQRTGAWHWDETANFRVYCLTGKEDAGRLAARCEALRQHLFSLWLADESPKAWRSRCEVIVFPNRDSYLQAVGAGAAQTAGSALIEMESGRVARRRIDLRGDLGRDMQSALAHEMTHVVIAERIDRGRIPAWADEGMAVLADMPEKQSLHAADLRQGLRSRTTFRVVDLLSLASYPRPARMGVFYGQSGALVSFLVGRGTPAQFVRFIELAIDHGYDRALRETYQIDGVAQLEQIWQQRLRRGDLRFASHVVDGYWSTAANGGE